MQVFEYYFNPKLKPDLIFESFCYEPENIYEKRVGSLYLVGVLKNALPQNFHLLEKLSKNIKDKYYSPTVKSPEKSLKDSLKRANDFLEELAKKGDVSWLGNLSFATLSIKNSELNFSKVGDFKIFLLRGKKITDIDKKVRFEEIEPYPLKIFLNVVSGKLAEDDAVLILSKEVFDFFQKEDLLTEISKISPLEEKKFREILNVREEKLKEVSGICLLILLTKEKLVGKKETILVKPKGKEFSLKEALLPLFSFFKKIRVPQIKSARMQPPKIPSLTLPKVKVPQLTIAPQINLLKERVKVLIKNKKVILVLSLISLLAIGFLIFQQEAKKQLREYRDILSQVREKKNLAEGLLILKSPQSSKEANLLLKESWEQISPILKIASTLPRNFQEELFSLKEEISENLYQLSNLVKIENPEVLFEFNTKEFVPQKMVSDGKNLYFFSPYSQNLMKVNYGGEGQIIETAEKFDLASAFDNIILFLSKPNKIVSLRDDKFAGTFLLEIPYLDFDFYDFSVFKSNLYFLDKKMGQIIKYPYLEDLRWDFPQLWLGSHTKKIIGANSIAVDGSVWVLNKEAVDKYYGGMFQEGLSLDIFPYPRNISKILTSPLLPYFYILEPTQKRIIILNKSGKIIQQFQSEAFDNLLDFAVSQNGKTIWLLNGLKVYQIEF